MKKQEYEAIKIEVIFFDDCDDVIVTSEPTQDTFDGEIG